MKHTTFEEALRILIEDEGVCPYPYDDATGERVRAPQGNVTIGVGINLDAGLDRYETDLLERHRMNREWLAFRERLSGMTGEMPHEAPLRSLDLDGLPDQAQLALALMAFQLGGARVCSFRLMLTAIAEGKWKKAAKEALDSKWDSQTPRRAERVAALLRSAGRASEGQAPAALRQPPAEAPAAPAPPQAPAGAPASVKSRLMGQIQRHRERAAGAPLPPDEAPAPDTGPQRWAPTATSEKVFKP